MTSSKRVGPHPVFPLLFLLAACGSGGEGGDDPLLPPPFVPTVECAADQGTPSNGSVTAQCGAVNGAVVSVDIIATTPPGGRPVVAAVLDLNFTPPLGGFGLSLESCTPGPALGSPAELLVDCTEPPGSPGELLAVVSRQDQGPGVTIAGSKRLMTIQFRVTGVGASPVSFVLPNSANGSALLERNASDPTQLDVIGGVGFAGAMVSGS